MTKIERVLRQLSDLRNFYVRLQQLKKAAKAAADSRARKGIPARDPGDAAKQKWVKMPKN